MKGAAKALKMSEVQSVTSYLALDQCSAVHTRPII
jgi:hypothetical protein